MDFTGDPLIIGFQITLVGVIIVFVVLTIVALALGAMPRIDELIERLRTRRPASPPARAPAALVEMPADQLTPALVAVLAAAAAEAFEQPVRITRVRYYEQPPTGTWSRQGRLTIMASRQSRR